MKEPVRIINTLDNTPSLGAGISFVQGILRVTHYSDNLVRRLIYMYQSSTMKPTFMTT
jgi:hypothetical protein